MKVLLITSSLPLDPAGSSAGLFIRQRLFIDALKMISEQVEVLYFAHHDAGFRSIEGSVEEMQRVVQVQWGQIFKLQICRRQAPLPRTRLLGYLKAAASIFWQRSYASTSGEPQLAALNCALSSSPDLVFVHRLVSFMPLLRATGQLPPLLFDLDDIEHNSLWRRLLRGPRQLQNLATLSCIPAIMLAERAAIRLSTTSFVCSDLDVTKLKRRFGVRNVQVVPNSIRIPAMVSRCQFPRLLMLGNYGYAPNSQGIEFFVERILPILQKAIPSVELWVAGPNERALSFALNPPSGVRVLGFVDNLDELYSQVAAVICPIFSGGGTRVKVIEAASYGMPIISTRIGAEGIELENGSEILIGDKPAAFANACARVLTDPGLASRIGSAARRVAMERYDRIVTIERLAAEFRKVAEMETY